jgi:PIN domain nuclease of toxin-antitoxin system
VILLLDAHALLWALVDPEQLATEARAAIEQPANDVIVSAASIWELEIKRAAGRLRFDVELTDELTRVAMSIVPITAADATAAARLPLHHPDPFDRVLVAQASRVGAVLVTRDEVFEQYDVDVLRA